MKFKKESEKMTEEKKNEREKIMEEKRKRREIKKMTCLWLKKVRLICIRIKDML